MRLKMAMLAVLAAGLAAMPAAADWYGNDQDGAERVTFQLGTRIQEGAYVDVYNNWDERFSTLTVKRVEAYGSTIEVEAYDWTRERYRTLRMNR